jgi:hypothetical protein
MVEGSTRGRPTSWIAVAIIIVGFAIGCLGLVLDNWLLWVGVALFAAGGIFGLATGIMSDVH